MHGGRFKTDFGAVVMNFSLSAAKPSQKTTANQGKFKRKSLHATSSIKHFVNQEKKSLH